eukprot:Rmarinus@m.3896
MPTAKGVSGSLLATLGTGRTMTPPWSLRTRATGFFSCAPNNCPNGDANSVAVCRKGHTGVLCAACLPDHWKLGFKCNTCNKESPLRMAILFVIVILGWLPFVHLASQSFPMLYSTLAFVQAIALLGDFDVVWPDSLLAIFQVSTLANFNINLSQFQCYVDYNFRQTWILRMALPLCYFLLFAARAVLAVIAYSSIMYIGIFLRHHNVNISPPAWLASLVPERSNVTLHLFLDGLIAKYGFVLNVLYVSSVSTSLEAYSCMELTDTYLFLTVDPETPCQGSEYESMASVAVLGLAIYMIGVPLTVQTILFRAGPRKLTDDQFQRRYGFFYTRFRPQVYWWDIIVGARKLALVSVRTMLARNSSAQIAATTALYTVALACHISVQPFRLVRYNILEAVLLAAIPLLVQCGLMLTEGENDSGPYEPITWFVFTVALVVVSCVAFLDILDLIFRVGLTFPLRTLWRKQTTKDENDIELPQHLKKTGMKLSAADESRLSARATPLFEEDVDISFEESPKLDSRKGSSITLPSNSNSPQWTLRQVPGSPSRRHQPATLSSPFTKRPPGYTLVSSSDAVVASGDTAGSSNAVGGSESYSSRSSTCSSNSSGLGSVFSCEGLGGAVKHSRSRASFTVEPSQVSRGEDASESARDRTGDAPQSHSAHSPARVSLPRAMGLTAHSPQRRCRSSSMSGSSNSGDSAVAHVCISSPTAGRTTATLITTVANGHSTAPVSSGIFDGSRRGTHRPSASRDAAESSLSSSKGLRPDHLEENEHKRGFPLKLLTVRSPTTLQSPISRLGVTASSPGATSSSNAENANDPSLGRWTHLGLFSSKQKGVRKVDPREEVHLQWKRGPLDSK